MYAPGRGGGGGYLRITMPTAALEPLPTRAGNVLRSAITSVPPWPMSPCGWLKLKMNSASSDRSAMRSAALP